jgi:hypothetical protein
MSTHPEKEIKGPCSSSGTGYGEEIKTALEGDEPSEQTAKLKLLNKNVATVVTSDLDHSSPPGALAEPRGELTGAVAGQ